MSTPDGCGLTREQLDVAFPFHFVLNADGNARQVGPGLRRAIPELLPGARVDHHLELVRPRIPFDAGVIRDSGPVLFVLGSRHSELTLRGQFLPQAPDAVLFLGSPWATSLDALKLARLQISDLALHDPTTDLLHLLYMQKLTVEDQQRLVERLSRQREELRRAHQQISEELADRVRAQALTRSILETAADAIVTIDETGTIHTVNRAFETAFGHSAAEVVGRNVHVLMPEPYRAQHDAHLRRFLETGEAHVIGKGREVVGLRRDGTTFPMFLSVGYMNAEGQQRFTGIIRDITDLKAQQEKLEASEARLRSVLENMLEGLVVFDGAGQVALSNPAARKIMGCDELEAGLGAGPEGCDRRDEILETVRVPLGEGRAARTEEIYTSDDRFIERTAVPVPLGPDASGTLVLMRDITERRSAQLALAAAREREEAIAARIQQTLLFGSIPVGVAGLEVAVLALPSQKVDGDFYEFYRYEAGVLDLVIGDVMGKGVAAALLGAAAKAHLQSAAAAILGESPAGRSRLPATDELINRLHSSMGHQLISLDSFITLCYARFHLKDQVLEFVDGGHPRTLHYRPSSGEARFLEGPNVPLGFLPQERYESCWAQLAQDDLLVFYSDGLTEAEGPQGEQFGPDRLAEAVRDASAGTAAQVLEAVRSAVDAFSAGQGAGDDLTCVVVRVGAPQHVTLRGHRELELRSDLFELPLIRRLVRGVVEDFFPAVDEMETYRLELAVNEAAANAMRHAYQGRRDGWLRLCADVGEDFARFSLFHRGLPLDPRALEEVPDVEEPREGGMGLFLITSICDEVTATTDSLGRHCLSMLRRLPAPGDAAGTPDPRGEAPGV